MLSAPAYCFLSLSLSVVQSAFVLSHLQVPVQLLHFLLLPVIISISSIPEATASSIIYCNVGLSTIGSISFG